MIFLSANSHLYSLLAAISNGSNYSGLLPTVNTTNFILGPDATLDTEKHKNSVRIKAPDSVNAAKRKHKNQIKHFLIFRTNTVMKGEQTLRVISVRVCHHLEADNRCDLTIISAFVLK